MGFRFRNRLRIAPGFYLNLGKRGANSVSARLGLFTANFNRDGVKSTVGLHGTGLSYESERTKGYSGGSKFLFALITLFILAYLIF